MLLERKHQSDEHNFEDESKHKQHIDDDYDDRWWCILACLPRSCSNFPQCSLQTTSHTLSIGWKEQRAHSVQDHWIISHWDRTSWVFFRHVKSVSHTWGSLNRSWWHESVSCSWLCVKTVFHNNDHQLICMILDGGEGGLCWFMIIGLQILLATHSVEQCSLHLTSSGPQSTLCPSMQRSMTESKLSLIALKYSQPWLYPREPWGESKHVWQTPQSLASIRTVSEFWNIEI